MARAIAMLTTRTRWFSPHTRGWPVIASERPTCCLRSPRTRGDGPFEHGTGRFPGCVLPAHAGMARITSVDATKWDAFSPHTRGWPVGNAVKVYGSAVLPAHAGMARRITP